jgi:hypothetical protein
MAKKELTELYSPDNAEQLKEEQRKSLANLTQEEVAELAKAHPNGPNTVPYLVLRDKTKKDNEQIFPRSTWQNYHSLLMLGQKQFVVADFVQHFKPENEKMGVAEEQDLSNEQAKSELRSAPIQNAAPGTTRGVQQAGKGRVIPDGQQPFDEEGNANEFEEENNEAAEEHARKAPAKKAARKKHK